MESARPDAVQVFEADLNNPVHCAAVEDMVDAYSRDQMGTGAELPQNVRQNVVPGLKKHPGTLIFLAFSNGDAVGIAVCFTGFSTFAAKPLINIHDLAVKPSHRRQGIARRLLEHVEAKAREMGCCKVTLEVQEDNLAAQHLYRAMGFGGGRAPMWFWTKSL